MTTTGEIVVERRGRVGIVRLNRPAALNALSFAMVRGIDRTLAEMEHEEAIDFVVLEGEGERAFCAGGDIRAIFETGRSDPDEVAAYWREEYRLNARIARYPKPVVALMRGVVMGGGAGLSIHATHRVVFSDTRFAMPEVGIGFVPDVGSTWHLARARGGLGRYLAYTGSTVGAADVLAAGLADRHVAAERLLALRAAVLAAKADDLDGIIGAFASEPLPGVFAEHGAAIRAAFRGDVEPVLAALHRDGSEFAMRTAATIRSRSPASLRLTERLIAMAASAPDLQACLNAEFVAAMRTVEGEDFYEGVRAAVIRKDRNPRWQPATLAEAARIGPEDLAASRWLPPFPLEETPA